MKRLLKQYGGMTLLVTHNRDEAYHLCDRIAPMDSGMILTLKPTKMLFDNPGTIAAAVITGCKNICTAVKTGEYEVEVPDWGLRLKTEHTVDDDLCAVGIRAHSFNAQTEQNRYPIYVMDEIEEPFEWTIQFRYQDQKDGTPDVWQRMPKDQKPQNTQALGVSPSDIQLLYPVSEG